MYSTDRRLERELLEFAKQQGYNGTPFLRTKPPIGFPEEELAAIDLSLSLTPRPDTHRRRQLVRDWARNIVFSSTGGHQ